MHVWSCANTQLPPAPSRSFCRACLCLFVLRWLLFALCIPCRHAGSCAVGCRAIIELSQSALA